MPCCGCCILKNFGEKTAISFWDHHHLNSVVVVARSWSSLSMIPLSLLALGSAFGLPRFFFFFFFCFFSSLSLWFYSWSRSTSPFTSSFFYTHTHGISVRVKSNAWMPINLRVTVSLLLLRPNFFSKLQCGLTTDDLYLLGYSLLKWCDILS